MIIKIRFKEEHKETLGYSSGILEIDAEQVFPGGIENLSDVELKSALEKDIRLPAGLLNEYNILTHPNGNVVISCL